MRVWPKNNAGNRALSIESGVRIWDARREAPLPAGAGCSSKFFINRTEHCSESIASVTSPRKLWVSARWSYRCGGTLNTIANMSMATPTYAYAYKYAAFDGLRRTARVGKESLDESARLSPNL